MKDLKQTSTTEAEPFVRPGATYLSMWILGLFGALTWWAFVYVDAQGGQFNSQVYAPYHTTNQLASFIPADPLTDAFRRGKLAYATYCLNCHQANGNGATGIAPPLAGSEWVLAEGPNRIIRIPYLGLTGPIKVKGAEYNMAMLAIAAGGGMTEQQVADVMTYIRMDWGNKVANPLVTPEQVSKVLSEIKDRTDPVTADELLKLPEQLP
jgi:mono/diheme cytochrome c family protein